MCNHTTRYEVNKYLLLDIQMEMQDANALCKVPDKKPSEILQLSTDKREYTLLIIQDE